jgi:arsenite-transporting ATPase
MSLATLDGGTQRVIMFGGKGGVGKTTTSASTALHYASADKRTLIISSDLSPSLSDIFETHIGPRETPIPGVPGLYGLEISSDEVMERWKIKFGPQVYAAATNLVDMPYDDLVDYAAMAPGIQEEFMLDYVLEQVKEGGYDVIVWDTAPAGDTLRLLDLPHKFLQHLRMAPKVYLGVRDKLRLKQTPFLELIASWSELAKEITDFFKDPTNTAFVMVTIPEALGVYQTRRLFDEFSRFGLQVRHLIINHVITAPDSDFMRSKEDMQTPYIWQLRHEYGQHVQIIQVPEFPHEVKGIEKLGRVERVLFDRSEKQH